MTKSVDGEKQLTASDIFDQVHGGSSSLLGIQGLIKRGSDEEIIYVADSTDCRSWHPIPTATITKVHFLGTMRCRGQVYPLVHIFMKSPATVEGKAFATVAQLQSVGAQSVVADLELAVRNAVDPTPPGHRCPHGQHWVWDQTEGWSCKRD